MFTHPNVTFSGGHISAPKVLLPQIFTHAREWQRFASPHLTGDGGLPPTISNNENYKIGLKFSVF